MHLKRLLAPLERKTQDVFSVIVCICTSHSCLQMYVYGTYISTRRGGWIKYLPFGRHVPASIFCHLHSKSALFEIMSPIWKIQNLGTVPRDFRLLVFSWICFPQAPDYTIRAVSKFFKNSRRYSVANEKKSSFRKIYIILLGQLWIVELIYI